MIASASPRHVPVGRWALNGMAALALVYILLPLVLVTWLAFFRQEIPSFPPEGYSLQMVRRGAQQQELRRRLHPELPGRRDGDPDRARARGAGESRDCAAALSGRGFAQRAAADAVDRARCRARPSIYVFQIETEIATGLPLLGSTAGLIAAHVLIVIPWAARLVTASLAGFDPAIEEAAKNLGAHAVDDVPARDAAGDPAGHRRGRAVRVRDLVRQSRDEPVPRRRRAAPRCRSRSCNISNGRSIRRSRPCR